jgi:hypothetical protein
VRLAVALAVTLAAAAAATGAHARRGVEVPPACPADTVRYTATRIGTPHVDLPGITGNLFYYTGTTLMDGRVNASDGLVIYAGGRNGPLATKILWTVRRGAGATLRIGGRRLDGPGSYASSWRGVGGGEFPSIVRLPSAGCWSLELASGKVRRNVVVEAVEPRAAPACDASKVQTGGHPRLGDVRWLPATPSSSGIAAVRFVTVFPGQDEAVIPPGGHFPGGPNTKFLWWTPKPSGALQILGTRLDAAGAFRATFGPATGDVGTGGGQTIYPSIIDVPTAGCWGLTLRMGRRAGLVVFRVVPAQS